MARKGPDFATPVRRVLIALMALALLALFLFWRIDSPRAEQMRTAMIDRIVPRFEWALLPVTRVTQMIAGFQSYTRLYEQNQELRRELQRMAAWKEAAVQLEQENSKLLAQNNVRIDPALTSVTGVVMVDSGSAFRQSVLLNVGAQDGIVEGWATMDGLGLVGRISGVGSRTSRVLLLTDPSSRLPVTVQPTGERALLTGDNTPCRCWSSSRRATMSGPVIGWSPRAMAACSRPAFWSVRWRRAPTAGCGCEWPPTMAGWSS